MEKSGPSPVEGEGRWPVITKGGWRVEPNMVDYQRTREKFSWEAARHHLNGLPGGKGLNIAHEAVDRHALGAGRHRLALRWVGKKGQRLDYTYGDLRDLSARFANALRDLEVGKGDRVFTLLGRVPELYVVALGTLKNGSVLCPLFAAFGPEPIRQRMIIGQAKVLVTTSTLYRRKVAEIRSGLPDLRQVILIDGEGEEGAAEDTLQLTGLLSRASVEFTIPPTRPEQPALLHFTSGTTGTPKGALHVHQAVVAHFVTGEYALDFHGDDIFWCTADPGWVTGTSYGIIAPLSHGIITVIDEAEFDVERWYSILQNEKVTVWYTAPTAIRMLMRVGAEVARRYDLAHLRLVASVGEPLNPEAVIWGQEAFGLPIHDNWWQTETGGIMISNYPSMPIKPGSMGKPLPGIQAGIVERREDGGVDVIDRPDVQGELALRPGWPSMFRGYWGEEERYRKCFAGGWYLSGDLARRDEDGYYWFVGRADDVIKSAGHLIGPFEVESALMEHPAVAEAAVIGMPDPIVGEVVKAFVLLQHGQEPGEELMLDILAFARKRLGPVVAPKEIAFRATLPKTRSGKIMRRLLKARELGLAEGDISTVEER